MCLQMLKSSVQYLLRYFVRCADFCRIVPKVTETHSVISGVSGPIFTKIAQNVAKILPFLQLQIGVAIFESVSKRQRVE